ncbi:MAG: hypothetical protein VB138_13900, partial [Burkholderia sp.]
LAACERHPARWSGQTRNWTPVGAVALDAHRQTRALLRQWHAEGLARASAPRRVAASALAEAPAAVSAARRKSAAPKAVTKPAAAIPAAQGRRCQTRRAACLARRQTVLALNPQAGVPARESAGRPGCATPFITTSLPLHAAGRVAAYARARPRPMTSARHDRRSIIFY